jgi:hypothetical protein
MTKLPRSAAPEWTPDRAALDDALKQEMLDLIALRKKVAEAERLISYRDSTDRQPDTAN